MSVLEQMEPIGLDDMKAVRLMQREDQKYLASADLLESILERVADHYFVQRIAGETLSPYKTLYFDTTTLTMYLQHHNRKLNRQKLRVRTYRATDTTFFEIKNKNNHQHTQKLRMPMDVSLFDHALDVPEVMNFIEQNTPYTTQTLIPTLENRFYRITLVDKGMNERITLDTDIQFHNHATGSDANLSRLLVVEAKHRAGTPATSISRVLHELHILPRRMSKYCIGTALTDSSVKHNRFKKKLLFIEKI